LGKLAASRGDLLRSSVSASAHRRQSALQILDALVNVKRLFGDPTPRADSGACDIGPCLPLRRGRPCGRGPLAGARAEGAQLRLSVLQLLHGAQLGFAQLATACAGLALATKRGLNLRTADSAGTRLLLARYIQATVGTEHCPERTRTRRAWRAIGVRTRARLSAPLALAPRGCAPKSN
jgi:hypothetical protein